jgi:ATP-dependent Clp protease adapter protein ClpS
LDQHYQNENFTEVIEEITDSDNTKYGSKVILFDDNYHTFNQVIKQLQKAIGCSEEEGFIHALAVHTTGKSEVYKGDMKNCLRVSTILQEIYLKTRIVI